MNNPESPVVERPGFFLRCEFSSDQDIRPEEAFDADISETGRGVYRCHHPACCRDRPFYQMEVSAVPEEHDGDPRWRMRRVVFHHSGLSLNHTTTMKQEWFHNDDVSANAAV
ncbi:MAG: hypothetical protein U0936_05755 [Planctomycetaceae bacterium]